MRTLNPLRGTFALDGTFLAPRQDFHHLKASRYLEYISRHLRLGQLILNAPSVSLQATGAAAAFEFSQDLPGALSRQGRHHDNDHDDIENIKLMPAYEDILSCRDG